MKAVNRLHYIDIIKGVAIMMVVFHHLDMAIKQYDCTLFYPITLYKYPNEFILPFFMSAFFVVTGFCSNFSQPFKTFLYKNLKTIILPCFCLYVINRLLQNFYITLYAEDSSWLTWKQWFSPGVITFLKEGGYYWFLSTMFITKTIYWFMNKAITNPWIKLGYSLLLLLIGVFINEYTLLPNTFFYQQAFIMILFLTLGQMLKRQSINDSILCGISALYLISYLLIFTFNIHVPSITKTVDITLKTLPLFLWLSLTGTCFIWWISKKINKNKRIEYLGCNSISIYAFNYMVLLFATRILTDLFHPNSTHSSITTFFLIYIVALLALSLLAWVVNLKYIRIMLGKF